MVLRRLRIAVLAILCSIGSSLGAQEHSILSHLSRSDRSSLSQGGSLAAVHRNVRDVRLAPDTASIQDELRTLRRSGANIVAERLMVRRGPTTEQDLVSLLNALAQVSQLSGIQYYNPEKDVHHRLFGESFRVVGADDLSRQADPEFSDLPSDFEIYVLQDTPPFGQVLQRYSFRRVTIDGMSGFAFSSQNVSDVRYRNVRVVRPGDMINAAWVLRDEDSLLVYGVGAADVFTGFGLFRDRIENSFSSRTNGLFEWLQTEHIDRL